jgi:hypothetical protein
LSIFGDFKHQSDVEQQGADPLNPSLKDTTMQYMMTFSEPNSELAKRNDPAQAPAYWAAWMNYIGELSQAGIVVSGNGLMPPEMGTTLRLRNGKRQIQDGPYPDTKEHLGGYFIIEVASLDVALDWAARAPCAEAGSVELRPVMPPPPQAAA